MWKIKKIADICDIRRGASPRPIQDFLDKKGMPWVKIADATSSNSRYIESTNQFIKEEGISKSVIVHPGTLILSNSATPGLPKIMKISACVHDGWLILSNFRDTTRDFIYYKLLDIRKDIINQANGSVFQNLKTDIVRNFDITLPPIEYQNKLVRFFTQIDDAIYNCNKINHNLEEQILAYYHNRFIENNSENHSICRMDEYFDISIGKTPPRRDFQWFKTNSNDVPWVSISDMAHCGLYINKSSEQLTEEAIEKFKIKVVPDNTVILSFKLTVGRIAVTDGKITTNEAIAHFKTDKKTINEYLYCYLKLFNYQTMGSTSSIATAINSKLVKEMRFLVPNADALREFHEYAYPRFQYIKKNQRQTSTLTALRDALLPKLMSGEIDVSAVEIGR